MKILLLSRLRLVPEALDAFPRIFKALVSSNVNFRCWRRISTLFLLCAVSPSQVFNTVASFDGTNGCGAQYMSFSQGTDGNLYGVTGATNGPGTISELSLHPKTLTTLLTALHTFNFTDGHDPYGGLVLANDGSFYGTAAWGGANNDGTVFKIDIQGTLTVLHNFDATDGAHPYGLLIQATDGNFYGTTNAGGGSTLCSGGCGTVFRMTPTGSLTTLYSFGYVDGANPIAGLVQYPDGDFYGTTFQSAGCTGGCGTIFKITGQGDLSTLYEFGDGGYLDAGLTVGADGNFYGTIEDGGIFQLTPTGNLTDLGYGGGPMYGGLVQATDGNFYGAGGNTLFQVTSTGTVTTLHTFCTQEGCPDGNMPAGTLFQATNGTLYGTTYDGGTYRCGTVFSLDMGLDSFVASVRPAGKVGQTGGILGQAFKGTSNVSLNGTPASFKVLSNTFIESTVPAGGTTGFFTVTTPSGTLTSNVPFQVIP